MDYSSSTRRDSAMQYGSGKNTEPVHEGFIPALILCYHGKGTKTILLTDPTKCIHYGHPYMLGSRPTCDIVVPARRLQVQFKFEPDSWDLWMMLDEGDATIAGYPIPCHRFQRIQYFSEVTFESKDNYFFKWIPKVQAMEIHLDTQERLSQSNALQAIHAQVKQLLHDMSVHSYKRKEDVDSITVEVDIALNEDCLNECKLRDAKSAPQTVNDSVSSVTMVETHISNQTEHVLRPTDPEDASLILQVETVTISVSQESSASAQASTNKNMAYLIECTHFSADHEDVRESKLPPKAAWQSQKGVSLHLTSKDSLLRTLSMMQTMLEFFERSPGQHVQHEEQIFDFCCHATSSTLPSVPICKLKKNLWHDETTNERGKQCVLQDDIYHYYHVNGD